MAGLSRQGVIDSLAELLNEQTRRDEASHAKRLAEHREKVRKGKVAERKLKAYAQRLIDGKVEAAVFFDTIRVSGYHSNPNEFADVRLSVESKPEFVESEGSQKLKEAIRLAKSLIGDEVSVSQLRELGIMKFLRAK